MIRLFSFSYKLCHITISLIVCLSLAKMATMLLPGDEVPAKWLSALSGTSNKQLKTVGPGLKVHSEQTLIATVAGILHETENKIWVESAETR
jgi:hypothetical protein